MAQCSVKFTVSMSVTNKCQQIINNMQNFRVEIERVRLENERLEKELEPYERWAEKAMEQLENFSIQNDIDIGMASMPDRRLLRYQDVDSDSDSDAATRKSQKRKYKKQKDLPFVVPDNVVEKKPAPVKPRKSTPLASKPIYPRQKVTIPAFPYRYYDIKMIVANNQEIVPGSHVTLSSPMVELFKVRPDLYYMALQNPIVI